MPIMEDVDLVRRIGMSRMVLFDVKARTSAKRYLKGLYKPHSEILSA